MPKGCFVTQHPCKPMKLKLNCMHFAHMGLHVWLGSGWVYVPRNLLFHLAESLIINSARATHPRCIKYSLLLVMRTTDK